MSETVASARELYERESTFRAGIKAWIADRRCDLRLVDILLEYGLTTQADCARWAATEPDRPFAQGGKGRTVCGPFPSCYAKDFYWFDCGSNTGKAKDSQDVPRKRFGREVNYKTNRFKTATDAILFLLDNWIPDSPEAPKRKRRKAK